VLIGAMRRCQNASALRANAPEVLCEHAGKTSMSVIAGFMAPGLYYLIFNSQFAARSTG